MWLVSASSANHCREVNPGYLHRATQLEVIRENAAPLVMGKPFRIPEHFVFQLGAREPKQGKQSFSKQPLVGLLCRMTDRLQFPNIQISFWSGSGILLFFLIWGQFLPSGPVFFSGSGSPGPDPRSMPFWCKHKPHAHHSALGVRRQQESGKEMGTPKCFTMPPPEIASISPMVSKTGFYCPPPRKQFPAGKDLDFLTFYSVNKRRAFSRPQCPSHLFTALWAELSFRIWFRRRIAPLLKVWKYIFYVK